MGLFDSILSTLGLKKDPPAAEDNAGEGTASAGGEADGSDDAGAGDPDPAEANADEDERDPELEAQDDSGTFDFDRDIARYFTAEFRIEQVWSSLERRVMLFEEYGIRDTKHWFQIRATFERWLETPEAKAKYPTKQDLLQARMTTTQTMTLDDLNLDR